MPASARRRPIPREACPQLLGRKRKKNDVTRKRKVLKWAGIGFGSVVSLLVLAAIGLYFRGASRIDQSYDVQVEDVQIPTDPEALARGRQLSNAPVGCWSCHGTNLGGDVLMDEAGIGKLYAPNLTSGQGGIGASYTDADWVRSIRHGVDPDGQGLILMPSDVFANLSREDLGAVIAYVKSVPPVDNEVPEPALGALAKILFGAGLLLDPLAAELIDHDAPFAQAPAPGATAEYGSYLVSIGFCQLCHGADLTGGKLDSLSKNAPNLTRRGIAGRWSEEQFVGALRFGVTPEGDQLDPEDMPWDIFTGMSDEDLHAIWLYIQSLPTGESAR
jgi:mono/diheme cytochrome c family protein